MELHLGGRVVLITGGAGAIGAAAAARFLKEGARVVIGDQLDSGGLALEGELAEEHGDRVAFMDCDLRSDASVESLVARSLDRFGRIDSIVHCAAVFHFEALTDWAGTGPIHEHFEVGLAGPMRLLRQAWRACPTSMSGSAVMVSSVAGHVGEPGAFAYTPIKAAQKGVTLAAAMEMSSHGGWAVTVSPGHTWTPVHQGRAESQGLTRAEYEASMANIQSTLFGRFLEPDEVASWIVLAASPLGKPLSGQDLRVTLGIEAGGFNRGYDTGVRDGE